MLEAKCHETNAFVTLTYDKEHLPADGSLDPIELRNFLYRLRQSVKPNRFRFFAVGEYGDESFRPHYHLLLFNFPVCRKGVSDFRRNSCCPVCDLVHRVWSRGIVKVGAVTDESAAYCTGYVSKKMTRKEDPRLDGKHPEFSRMSTRPGLGALALDDVASKLLELDLHKTLPDVPSALRIGSKVMPLGRYLRRKLRERIGRSPNAPQSTLDEMEEQLRLVREAAIIDTPRVGQKNAFKGALVTRSLQKRRSLEAKSKIFKTRKSL